MATFLQGIDIEIHCFAETEAAITRHRVYAVDFDGERAV